MKRYKEYLNKKINAKEAAAIIKSGDWVDYGAFCAAPVTFDKELAKRAGELSDVKIRALAFPGIAEVSSQDNSDSSFIYNNWHFSGGDRKCHDRGNCHFIPFVYHEGPGHYYQKNITNNICVLTVSPMDKFGNFNFGIANSFQRAMIDSADIVIVEVNENIPVCLGGAGEIVHISEVDFVVESDNPSLLTLPEPNISQIDKQIASIIVEQIEDGSCIQLGIGGMPNAVGKLIAKSDLKDLGAHTEMFADAYLDMYKAGKLTNIRKARDRGKSVYTFALGSQELYEFLHLNAECASYPVDYTNDLAAIAANDKMISINNAIEVDLYGQVSSESSGFRHITGTGGQFDFAYGAYHSKGGKSFICLSSTATDKNGNITSRINPVFSPGTITTLPRSITHYVVTEYGMVNLKGKSTWERAEALISIAHPDFREELIRDAEKMNIWLKKNDRAGKRDISAA